MARGLVVRGLWCWLSFEVATGKGLFEQCPAPASGGVYLSTAISAWTSFDDSPIVGGPCEWSIDDYVTAEARNPTQIDLDPDTVETDARQLLTAQFACFDAAKAQCYKVEDREKLLAVIEAAFGDFKEFNRSVRAVFATRVRSRGGSTPRSSVSRWIHGQHEGVSTPLSQQDRQSRAVELRQTCSGQL